MKDYIHTLREELATLSPRLRRIIYFLAIAPSLLWTPMAYLMQRTLVARADSDRFIMDALAAGGSSDKIEQAFTSQGALFHAWMIFVACMLVVGLFGAALSFLMPSKPKAKTPDKSQATSAQA